VPEYASRYPDIEGVTPSLRDDVDADPADDCETHVAAATYDFGAASTDRHLAVTLIPEYDSGAVAPRAWSAEITASGGQPGVFERSDDAFATPDEAVDALEAILPALDPVE
jgi:hypothetical protein